VSVSDDIEVAKKAVLVFAADIHRIPPEIVPVIAVGGEHVMLAGTPRAAIPDLFACLDIEEELRDLALSPQSAQGVYRERVVLVMVLLDVYAAWAPPNLRHLGAMTVTTIPTTPGPRGVA